MAWYHEENERWKVNLPEGSLGSVEIRKFEVREDTAEYLRAFIQGRPPIPGEYTMLLRNGSLWMSDTTAEQQDHWAPYREVRRRGGRVLVAGLGLGMFVKRVLELPNVEHVDVVEIDPDVVGLVGPHYEGERCTIHLGDIFQMKWPVGTRWSYAWFDIWQDICSDNLAEMTKLARSYGRRVDAQGFWSKDMALRLKRRWG